MGGKAKAGWGVLQVRAQRSWGDGKGPSALRWRGFQSVYPDFEEALSWAHDGSAVFGRPSGRRLPHPTVKGAVLVVEPPSLWMVFPIPAGADRRSHSESVYRAAPADWLVRLLLP
ncbi:hypothetical protein [Streptomyces sp. RFCAC02]|uniref:hypothetical protein n=1 Tax=Streptomyces sp. RFCAC02 TaxID=2499143 RepID=UPI00101F7505|nr:hypothetical protein [Streptomyces sp. RFCAC02]